MARVRELRYGGQYSRHPEVPALATPIHAQSEEAFRAWLTELMADEWDSMVRFVCSVTPVKEAAAAQDVVQDAIIKILAGAVTIPDDREQALKTVYATIRNVARNHHRTEKVRKTDPLSLSDVDVSSAKEIACMDELVWAMSRRIEIGKLLTEAVRCLTESEAEVVELEYGKELSVAEIARQKGCSRSAVRKLRAKALAKMRAKIDGQFGPE